MVWFTQPVAHHVHKLVRILETNLKNSVTAPHVLKVVSVQLDLYRMVSYQENYLFNYIIKLFVAIKKNSGSDGRIQAWNLLVHMLKS